MAKMYPISDALKKQIYDYIADRHELSNFVVHQYSLFPERRRRGAKHPYCSPCVFCGHIFQPGEDFYYITYGMSTSWGHASGGVVACAARTPCNLKVAVKNDQ